MVLFMAVAALGYTVAFHHSVRGFVKGMVYAVLVDFVLVGLLAASLGWHIANTYLLVERSGGGHTTEQTVEWLYAIDVHCNSSFPFFMLLHVLQFFLLPLLLKDGLFVCILANALYAIAFSFYFYITFLGYAAMPFLQHTTIFLYPIGVVLLVCVSCSITRFNICHHVMRAHFG